MNNSDNAEEREAIAVRARYDRRGGDLRYHLSNADVWQTIQERERAILKLLFRRLQWTDLSAKKLVEVGCGNGGNLLELLRLGFSPENLKGIELLRERALQSRRVLPSSLEVFEGDACAASIARNSHDIVYQSVVFSSLLDDAFQEKLATTMWSWVRPGGGVLWYDFLYDNPSNRDVRGVPIRRIRSLFPHADMCFTRITLAPPISRRVCRIHANAYHVLNAIPWLRTHVLCWLQKKIICHE